MFEPVITEMNYQIPARESPDSLNALLDAFLRELSNQK